MPGKLTANELVRKYELQPHPEGGYFRETYRATGQIKKDALPPTYHGDRNYSTAIYYLLSEGERSKFKRLASDEVWHFYLGGPLTIVQINPDGRVEEIILGSDIKKGQRVQHVVPAGYWFGAYPVTGASYSFVGCTVAPGFDFQDFEIAKRESMEKAFPKAAHVIQKLT
jgi:hypothetical protein